MSSSSSVVAKNRLRLKSYLAAHEVLNNDDVMYEILLRLPPETMYSLIQVSRRWLQIICNPLFRKFYLTRWKQRYDLMGFFIRHDSNSHERPVKKSRRSRWFSSEISEPSLLSVSITCNELESSGYLKRRDYYIDSHNGFLLYGSHPKDYYLWDPNRNMRYFLPKPRDQFKEVCMSLIIEECDYSDNSFSYKMIRAECGSYITRNKYVKLHTYSSKTTSWSYSELTCLEVISLRPKTLSKVIDGVVYWFTTEDKLAIYDTNYETKKKNDITVINLPKTFYFDEHVLGESADGCLLYGRSTEFRMRVWKLENVNGSFDWICQYKVRFEDVWLNNPKATRIFKDLTKETMLVAFFHQNSDLVYIKRQRYMFILDLKTNEVKQICSSRLTSLCSYFCNVVPYFGPIWPSLGKISE